MISERRNTNCLREAIMKGCLYSSKMEKVNPEESLPGGVRDNHMLRGCVIIDY